MPGKSERETHVSVAWDDTEAMDDNVSIGYSNELTRPIAKHDRT